MINHWNGWYGLDHLNLNELKSLYKEALLLADKTFCDVKDDNYRRIIDDSITPEEWIDKYLTLNTHNVFCNRYVYNNFASWSEQYGELGSCTLHLSRDKFLWIYFSLENLEILVEKFNLPKKKL